MEEGELSAKLQQTKVVIEEVSKQFKTPVFAPFSLYFSLFDTGISSGIDNVCMCDDS